MANLCLSIGFCQGGEGGEEERWGRGGGGGKEKDKGELEIVEGGGQRR